MPFDSTPIKSDPVVERLQLARSRIEAGWQRRDYVLTSNKTRSYCAMGAIWCSDEDWCTDDLRNSHTRAYAEVANQAFQFLCKALGHSSVIVWNDTKANSKDEVLTVFDKAIVLAMRETADAV